MADSSTKNKIEISSWVCPTQEDDRLWQAMTREEQVSALRELTSHPVQQPVHPLSLTRYVAGRMT